MNVAEGVCFACGGNKGAVRLYSERAGVAAALPSRLL